MLAESMAIRRMRLDDVAHADRLREQAGWNQTLADWQRVLNWEPEGCFVAEQDERVVGTVTTTVYASELAWVGMMLIDQAMRRQGIGRRLLTHALEWLESQRGVACVGLDATPQGKLLYDGLGFVDAYTLQRRHGIARRVEVPPSVRALTASDVARVVALDRRALGVDRARLLVALHAAHPSGSFVLEQHGELLGYALSRPGAHRWYMGPIVARDSAAADALLRAMLGPLVDQPVVIDTVDNNVSVSSVVDALGFAAVRPFFRMWRGKPLPQADPERVCVGIVAPEVG